MLCLWSEAFGLSCWPVGVPVDALLCGVSVAWHVRQGTSKTPKAGENTSEAAAPQLCLTWWESPRSQ